MNMNITSGRGGLSLNGIYISNAVPIINGLYAISGEDEIFIVKVTVWVGSLPPKTCYVPAENLNFATLQKEVPVMICTDSRWHLRCHRRRRNDWTGKSSCDYRSETCQY